MSVSFARFGKFSIIFSNSFQCLTLSLLLPASPWGNCWHVLSCPICSLPYFHFLRFFFLCSVLIGWFVLPYLSTHWFEPVLHLFQDWFPVMYSFFLISIFYCYSITVVCLFSPALHPTPAEPPSLSHLHPPLWFCPCVLYSSSCNPLSSLPPPHSPLTIVRLFLTSMSLEAT